MDFTLPAFAQLKLSRYPKSSDQSLRAWNAADELLLQTLAQHINTQKDYLPHCDIKPENSESTLSKKPKILIINDQFGGLSVPLEKLQPFYWTDSFLSQQAIAINSKDNHAQPPIFFNEFTQNIDQVKEENSVCPINSVTTPANKTIFDFVLLRIPKHNSLLAFQLAQLTSYCHNNTVIIAAGMTKEIHNSNIQLFEKYIGETKTSLAKKKARLILPSMSLSNRGSSEVSSPGHCPFNKSQVTNKTPNQLKPQTNGSNPASFQSYTLASAGIEVFGLPGVFSRKSLDIGSQVMLDYLPQLKQNQKIIDLGCGNGVLAAVLAKTNKSCQFVLTDESKLAIESAKLTFENNQLTNGTFIQTDILKGIKDYDFDHIICNPPFHQQNVQTLTIAKNMFKQAAQYLSQTGELRVVANRHLKYLPILKSYFKHVRSISTNAKFTVWLATQPKNSNH